MVLIEHFSKGFNKPCTSDMAILSSLVLADSCLKFRFSFTRDSYKSFLLRHGSFSYVIVSQKTYTQDEGTICLGRGNNFYSLSLRKTFYFVKSGRFLNGE